MILDAHFHLKQLLEISYQSAEFIRENDFFGFCSCRTLQEVEFVENFIAQNPGTEKKLEISFGIHPQDPQEKELKTLEKLIAENRIAAIGEIGLDRFNEEFAETFDLQKQLFSVQLEIAEKSELPVILHIRKAVPEVFEQIQQLKKIKKVIFHSYSGTAAEAESIMNHGVNAFFSFGNALLNGHKKAVETVKFLPEERILTETDAPYQPKKGETFSKPDDILLIQAKIKEIRHSERSEESRDVSLTLNMTQDVSAEPQHDGAFRHSERSEESGNVSLPLNMTREKDCESEKNNK